MKKIILLSVLSIVLFGCGPSAEQRALEAQQYADETKNVTNVVLNNPHFQIITIDSCEYVLYRRNEGYQNSYSSGLCHKGNCKFCAERKNQ